MQFSDLESAKPNVCQLFNVVSLREERSLSRDSSTKHPSPGRPVDPELRDRRIAEILQVAARLFAEHGYTNTNIQSIADHLQISKGLVYRYFASKEKLFAACLEDAVSREDHRDLRFLRFGLGLFQYLKQECSRPSDLLVASIEQ